jgi:hypothetical protein
MANRRKSKTRRRRRPLYHSAKISAYRFRRILWHFVRDRSASETARRTGLSVNSVNDLYRKIRIYFFEAGLFMDFYGGAGWAKYDPEADKEFEQSLLAFHRSRLRGRPVRTRSAELDYHLAESWWRLDFAMIMRERRSEVVYDMMMGQLLAVIRVAGPVGRKPGNRAERRRVIARLTDQKILWLQRNAPSFATAELRSGLEDALRTEPPDL